MKIFVLFSFLLTFYYSSTCDENGMDWELCFGLGLPVLTNSISEISSDNDIFLSSDKLISGEIACRYRFYNNFKLSFNINFSMFNLQTKVDDYFEQKYDEENYFISTSVDKTKFALGSWTFGIINDIKFGQFIFSPEIAIGLNDFSYKYLASIEMMEKGTNYRKKFSIDFKTENPKFCIIPSLCLKYKFYEYNSHPFEFFIKTNYFYIFRTVSINTTETDILKNYKFSSTSFDQDYHVINIFGGLIYGF